MKTFSIRVPDSATAGVTSEAMQARLREFFVSGSTGGIPDDPGAGPTVIRRTLPENLVSKFSAALGVTTSEALRRLAVSCARALPAAPNQPPARGLPSRRPVASNPEPAPWWAALLQPVGARQSKSTAKDPQAFQKATISPWRAFWRQAGPDLLILGAVLLIGSLTGGLDVGSDAAAEPYSNWRPE